MRDGMRGSSSSQFAKKVSALLSGAGALGFLLWYILRISAGDTLIAALDPAGNSVEATPRRGATVNIATRLQSGLTDKEWAAGEDDSRLPRFLRRAHNPRLRLVGVMQVGQAPERALIRGVTYDQGKWLSVGEVIQGWQLRQITKDSALVEREGQIRRLQLSEAVAVNQTK